MLKKYYCESKSVCNGLHHDIAGISRVQKPIGPVLPFSFPVHHRFTGMIQNNHADSSINQDLASYYWMYW